jgi:hypothetical protein
MLHSPGSILLWDIVGIGNAAVTIEPKSGANGAKQRLERNSYESWVGRVPQLKAGSYADGMPLHQMQYLCCTLPLAMAATVLISSYVVRIPTMWRQAPITAAFVIAAGLEHHSRVIGLQAGMDRMYEVLFGCVIGLAVEGWYPFFGRNR